MGGKSMIPFSIPRREDDDMAARAAAFHDMVRTRRTVRDFSPDPVPASIIRDCIRSAATAPSGANLQPWHFVAVSEPATRKRIRIAAEAEEKEFYESRATKEWKQVLAPLGVDANKPFLETAPWLIAVFAVHHYDDQESGERRQTYYPKESVGIATGVLITALHQAGLATLSHTPCPMRFLNEILERPATEKPFLLLVVGHPAPGAKVPAITKKPFKDIATMR